MLGLPGEFIRETVDQAFDREIFEFGRDGTRVEPRDIEQGVQQVGHGRQRVRLAVDHLQRLFVLDRPPQRPV